MRATSAIKLLTLVLAAVAGATGLWLAGYYRPSSMLYAGTSNRIHLTHVAASWSFVAGGTFLAVASWWPKQRRSARGAASGAAVLVAMAMAAVTASRIRWDGIAFWAVTADDPFKGIWPPAFDEQVRFVTVGGDTEEPTEYRTRVLAHLVAAPLLLLSSAMVHRWFTTDRSRSV